MPETYMDEDLDQEQAAPEETSEAPEKSEEDENEGAALLNKSLFPDAKVGDKLTVEVTHVYEEELAVKSSREKNKTNSDKEPTDLDQYPVDNLDTMME